MPGSKLTFKYVDDGAEMALRHLDFDVEALGEIAAKASGASECNEIEVIAEDHSDNFFPRQLCSILYRDIQPRLSSRFRGRKKCHCSYPVP